MLLTSHPDGQMACCVVCVVFLMNIEQGDRTAVHMSVVSLTLMLSLNITVTNSLFFSIFYLSIFSHLCLLLSFSTPSVSSISLFDFLLLHLVLSNTSKLMVSSLLFLTFFNFSLSLSSPCYPSFGLLLIMLYSSFLLSFLISIHHLTPFCSFPLFLFCLLLLFLTLLLFFYTVHLVLYQRQWWWTATSLQ